MEELKDQTLNSELTMMANQTFNDIVNKVQNSHLNYQLQLSPFSAIISLKKPLIKTRFGQIIMPKTNCDASESNCYMKKKICLKKICLAYRRSMKV